MEAKDQTDPASTEHLGESGAIGRTTVRRLRQKKPLAPLNSKTLPEWIWNWKQVPNE